MSHPVRSGIIGAGGMIGVVHARAVRAAGGRLVAVAGHDAAGGRRAAERTGAERAAADGWEIVGAPDVDLVHVCTPNDLHAEFAAAALRSGQHVICEKPLATTREDADSIAALAASSPQVAAIPFVYRFYATVREMRHRLAVGERPWLIHGGYLQDWAVSEHAGWRRDPARSGPSRAFGDIGVHWCDLMEFVTGDRISRLSATLATADSSAVVGDEDGCVIVFETERGVSGSAVISQASPGRGNRLALSIDGPRVALAFNQEQPDALWVGEPGSSTVVVKDPDRLSAAATRYARLPAGHPEGYQDSFDAFVRDVHRAIAGEVVDGLPTFADGSRAAHITEAVLRSAVERVWVAL